MKRSIRQKMKAKLNELSKQEAKEKTKKIEEKLLSLDAFLDALSIGAYYPLEKEVCTLSIIRALYKKKQFSLPHLEERGVMRFALFKGFKAIKKGRFGIPEPHPKEETEPSDVLLVPGLAFDEKGARIGRGKGYYDRYLKGKKVLKISLAYEFQVLKSIPLEPHDIMVDYIITEKRIRTIKS
ncbi:5-formyltetrahydrofolate cyclo-ligase [Candidatus Micrarchaeota archaeon]|nr:5-formyltetrahydrofolate cyclo-ligase [Candidatus Micrarchaeota archaeon]